MKLITGRLDAAGIAYMITGSIAGGHYGHPRMTRDIDLVIELRDRDVDRFCTILGSEFMVNREGIRSAIARRSMFNAIHEEALVKVDFVVRKDDDYRIEEFRRRRRVRVEDHELWIVSPEDLILSKLLWAKETESELQLRDVRGILRVQREALEWAYLDRWAADLSVAHLLQEAR